jgi:tetratricopeptide (TPR) repeat protein
MSVNLSQTMSAPRGLSRSSALWLRYKAKGLLVLGLRAQATQVFKEILAQAPGNVLALSSLGYDAMTHGRLTEALAYFEKLALHAPTDCNAHFNLGFVNEALGYSQEAERAFRAAIALDEKMDRAWYGLGLALVRQRRFDESLDAFKRNTELQSMSPFAWYQMARVHMELNQPEEALAVMRHLNGFEPKVAAQLERETGLHLKSPA